MSLKGAVVVVIGGSSGIGLSVAVGAAERGAAKVFVVRRDEAKLAAAKAAVENAASDPTCVVHTDSVDVLDEPAVQRCRSFPVSKPAWLDRARRVLIAPGTSPRASASPR